MGALYMENVLDGSETGTLSFLTTGSRAFLFIKAPYKLSKELF